jgi:hypothetical protein
VPLATEVSIVSAAAPDPLGDGVHAALVRVASSAAAAACVSAAAPDTAEQSGYV